MQSLSMPSLEIYRNNFLIVKNISCLSAKVFHFAFDKGNLKLHYYGKSVDNLIESVFIGVEWCVWSVIQLNKADGVIYKYSIHLQFTLRILTERKGPPTTSKTNWGYYNVSEVGTFLMKMAYDWTN